MQNFKQREKHAEIFRIQQSGYETQKEWGVYTIVHHKQVLNVNMQHSICHIRTCSAPKEIDSREKCMNNGLQQKNNKQDYTEKAIAYSIHLSRILQHRQG